MTDASRSGTATALHEDAVSGSAAAEALDLVRRGLDDMAGQVVPWFFGNMPEYYLRTHSVTEKVHHLQAIISGRAVTGSQTVRLMAPDGRKATYLVPGGGTKELLTILEAHVAQEIETARLYTTQDGQLHLVEFLFGEQPRADVSGDLFAEAVSAMRGEGVSGDRIDLFERMLRGANAEYLEKFDPQRALRHLHMLESVGRSEDTAILLEQCTPGSETRLVMAMRHPPATGLLLQTAKILARTGVTVNRCYGDSFNLDDGDSVAILSFYVNVGGDILHEDSELWQRLRRKLQLVKWFAPNPFESYADREGWSLKRVMLLAAAAEFAHAFLVQENQWAYSTNNVTRILQERRGEVARLVAWFEARFDPTLGGREAKARELDEAALAAVGDVADESERTVLLMVHRFFAFTLRTNYFLEDIYGLSFRLDPQFLPAPCRIEGEELPYGIFFFHGPYCMGFHIRYRDMSRGGVRVVPTRSAEQFELESNRLYDEVKGLAYAQQVKNKDIPEGGSKAVILLGPLGDIRLAVASMGNSLLDVILCGESSPTLPGVVDHLGKEEIIYLGPDENITPEHITWIVERARQRGYRWPSAFMSSKPGAGINHKQYGVTSLGVMVFAEEVLRHLGIDPATQPFTVKITGGPKGDVAGNLMRIMFRDYGDNARVVAVTDGHGAAYDPEGLDRAELMRLVDGQRSIDAFDAALLRGEGAFVVSARDPETVRLRNALHNTARADIFIPSGGRPNTINMRNWHEFFDGDGVPTARAIVEGANLFVSPDARKRLAERGVLVVHGSSANKTGVICSSYEVLGGLVMTDGEFIAAKERYVADVFDILRRRARDEARLLLAELRRCDRCKPLHVISVEASQEMNHAADALYGAFMQRRPDIAEDSLWRGLVLDYCPAVLVEKFRDRIFDMVPRRHLYALIAAYAASAIVYAEGMGWLAGVGTQRDIVDVVRNWHEARALMLRLATAVESTDMEQSAQVAHLLRHGGVRRFTEERLGLA